MNSTRQLANTTLLSVLCSSATVMNEATQFTQHVKIWVYVSIPQCMQVPRTALQDGSGASTEYHTDHMPGHKEPSTATWHLLPNCTTWNEGLVFLIQSFIHSYILIYWKAIPQRSHSEVLRLCITNFSCSNCHLIFQSIVAHPFTIAHSLVVLL